MPRRSTRSPAGPATTRAPKARRSGTWWPSTSRRRRPSPSTLPTTSRSAASEIAGRIEAGTKRTTEGEAPWRKRTAAQGAWHQPPRLLGRARHGGRRRRERRSSCPGRRPRQGAREEPSPQRARLVEGAGDGVATHPYGKPSKFEKTVIRRDVEWLTASRESSINFTPIYALDGIITPNGLCFERHHGGAAEINPAEHRLMIHASSRSR